MATCIKRGNSYELRIYHNKKMHTRTFRPPEDITPGQLALALEQEMETFEKDLELDRKITAYSTFKETALYWMENVAKERLAPKTVERYEGLFKRIFASSIGSTKLRDIDQMQLNEFYFSLMKRGTNKLTGGSLSPKTVREYHNLISRVLNAAWRWGVINENIAKRAEPPTVHRGEIQCMTEEEAREVLRLLDEEPLPYRLMITILLLCGCRRGELCGLEWKDINFDRMTIRIQRSSQYVNHEIITKEPKTARSNRTITMDAHTANLLKEYRAHQSQQRLEAGQFWQDYDRLFTKADGSPIHPDTVGDWWNKFQERHGLKHYSLHSLRHTNASLLIANDLDVATVSGRLGHADASTTLNIYTHQFRARDQMAASMLGEFANDALHDAEPDAAEKIQSIDSMRGAG